MIRSRTRSMMALAALCSGLAACAEAGVVGARPVRHVSFLVRGPTPEEAEGFAARLPACRLRERPGEARGAARSSRLALAFPLPPGFVEDSAIAAEAPHTAAFISEMDTAALFLERVRDVEGSPSFVLAVADAEPVDEGECALRIGGRLASVALARYVQESGTSYVATAHVVLGVGDFLGVGVLARSPADRDRLLASVAGLRLSVP